MTARKDDWLAKGVSGTPPGRRATPRAVARDFREQSDEVPALRSTPAPGEPAPDPHAADRLARLRHQLRSPLSAVIGYSEMLLEDASDLGDVALLDAVTGLYTLAKRVLSLIGSLLDPTAHTLRDLDPSRQRRELHAPLNELINRAELLQRSLKPRREAAFIPDLQKVQAAAHKLLGLVDDMLALAGTQAAVEAATGGVIPETALDPARIIQDRGALLLVDGHEANREMLQHRLERRGFVVDAAACGEEALRLIDTQFYDLVLLDGETTDLPGIEVLKAIRERLSAIELPIIMLTLKDDTEDIVEALQLGANDYLTQPIDFPVAVARIRTQLSLRRVTRQLEEANARLQRFSYLDGLTGIANRRRFDEFLAESWRRAIQMHTPVALVLIDVDHFKLFNDAHGHAAGDEALRQVARALQDSLHRAEDVVARYGGEEFAVVLPGVALEGAVVVAERMRAAVAALSVRPGRQAQGQLTVSLGVASTVPAAKANQSTLVVAADGQLYRAKREGRNQVCRG